MVQQNGRRRVAIYCRVSTSDQDNDRQERDLMEHAEPLANNSLHCRL